jgi:hypothetical protein
MKLSWQSEASLNRPKSSFYGYGRHAQHILKCINLLLPRSLPK